MPLSKREVATNVINNMPLGSWKTLSELTKNAHTSMGCTLLRSQMCRYLTAAKKLGILEHKGKRVRMRISDVYISMWKRVSDEKFL